MIYHSPINKSDNESIINQSIDPSINHSVSQSSNIKQRALQLQETIYNKKV